MRSYKRSERVASLIRDALSELILLECGDPRTRGAVITNVRVSDDMSIARVYVRSIAGDDQGRKEVLDGLYSSRAFLRQALLKRVQLVKAPTLIFHFDDVPDEAARIEALLAGLKESK
jgi:ribosome-binding factor A